MSEFRNLYRRYLDEKDLLPEQRYNADETGLYWRLLPNKTLAHSGESNAPAHKQAKERVTLLCCANETGDHMMKVMMVGKAKNPRCFHHQLQELGHSLQEPSKCMG